MQLYNYFRSSASYRVRIALALKNLDYEYKKVHLLNNGGEQNLSDYTKLNPLRQVPTLVDGDFTLSQSLPILEYLDEAYPETLKLFPNDIKKKALIREFCEIINAGIQPLQNLKVLQTLDDMFKPHPMKKTEWMHFWIGRGFEAIEEKLKSSSGTYCFGSTITAADCFLVPQVFSSIRFGYQIETHSNIQRVYNNLLEVEAIDKAAPQNQPDFA